MKQRKLLEGLQPTGKKAVYLELAGGTPLLPERREILLKARIVAVRGKRITIDIPLKHVSTVSQNWFRNHGGLPRETLIKMV